MSPNEDLSSRSNGTAAAAAVLHSAAAPPAAGSGAHAAAAALSSLPSLNRCLERVRANQIAQLRHDLAQALSAQGLVRFLTGLVAPLNVAVGDAWMRGELEIFQEHAYSQAVSALLRRTIDRLPEAGASARPRVLLTTIAHEPHALGLLMAEAIFANEGCDCVSLGPQTPPDDICAAASGYAIDLVALSFTDIAGASAMVESVARIRAALAPSVEIWVGGRFAAQHGNLLVSNAVVVDALEDIPQQLAAWRGRHSETRRRGA